MKADSLKVSQVFSSGGDILYILPHFQREYAWDKANWQMLVKDVFSVYDIFNPMEPPEHFMGALVVINDGTKAGVIPAFKLVDGQQRLISISLLLCALGRVAQDTHPSLHKKIQKLLLNSDEDGLIRYKLLPTKKYGDQAAYLAILEGSEIKKSVDSKIPHAFEFFTAELDARKRRNELEPDKLFVVLTTCLQVVFINLDKQERPYEIFESLNAKGKPLSQADLVRNYIAMRLPETRQEEIFDSLWSPIENMLQETRTVGRSRLGELTAFLRHYLAFRSGVLCNEEHVYARFRDRIEAEFKTPEAFTDEIAELGRFASYYDCLLRPGQEPDPMVSKALSRLITLEVSTAYPFLLSVYEAYRSGLLAKGEVLKGLGHIENYIVRRYLAGDQTNYTNKMFPTLRRDIDFTTFSQSLSQALVTRNYPSDHRIRQNVLNESFYDRSGNTREKIRLVLDSVNKHLSTGTGGYTTLDGDATIEHIMPQTLSPEWKVSLGSEWEQTYNDELNTLGNLTLVTREWNSSLSNSQFSVKRKEFEKHGLLLNSHYFSRPIASWNASEIRARAEYLVDNIIAIWPPLVENLAATQAALGVTPTALIILGEHREVKYWKDIAYEMADCISQLVDDFESVTVAAPGYFAREKFKTTCRQLPNGWWIYLNLSSKNVKNLCKTLAATADLADEHWQIVYD